MKQLLASWTLLVFSTLVVVVAVAVPVLLYVRITQSLAYVAEVEGKLVQDAAREENAHRARLAAQETEADRAKLTGLAVPSGGAAEFIRDVEEAARLSRISVEIGSVDVAKEEGVFDSLNLSLQAAGSFAATTRFLMLLETLPTLTVIDSVSFERQEKTGWKVTLRLHAPIHKQQ